MLVRRDIWKLTEEDPWHPVILAYARAVGELQSRNGTDFSDPTCWRYLSEIHGTGIDQSQWPAGATWNQCEHGSWFFLPWHRVYLHYFETVVRDAVQKLGGPADWALPYWDYSDPGRPETRALPPAFRAEKLPSGEDNPLFVRSRDPDVNDGARLLPDSVDVVEAMGEKKFAGRMGLPSFGGGATRERAHNAGLEGALENRPHGWVHGDVGGPGGWMSSFSTAGRDPVFWLHHANVDRLWEVWVGLEDGRENPADSLWLGMKFTVGHGPGGVTLAVRDVLDTTRAPLEYRYENVTLPRVEPGPLDARVGPKVPDDQEVRMRDRVPPETIGASEPRVPLAGTPTAVEVPVEVAAERPGRTRFSLDARDSQEPAPLYLKVENVQGGEPAAIGYLVHVNVPQDADPAEYPDRQVGTISTFGVPEASGSDETHNGSGLSYTFDMTAVAGRLREAGEWDPARLRVTFTPIQRKSARRKRMGAAAQDGDLAVGRVSVLQG